MLTAFLPVKLSSSRFANACIKTSLQISPAPQSFLLSQMQINISFSLNNKIKISVKSKYKFVC